MRILNMAALGLLASIALCVIGCGGDDTSAPPAPPPPRPIDWKPLPTEGAPSARYLHTAVWTGSKMIIWGGNVGGMKPVTATGAAYDPATKTWSPTSMTGAPSARHLHTAVWTGSKMLIWGGFGETSPATDGGIYDPASDTWSPMSTAGQPSPRTNHSAVWTGKTMVIWGGALNASVLGDGAAYDPKADTWTALSKGSAPSPRFNHSAALAGAKLIVWGGYNFFDWRSDGATLDLSGGGGGSWVGATGATTGLTPREGHTGVWTGSQMLIWGGWTGGPYDGNGAQFSLASNAWAPMPTEGAPSARGEHIGLWAGDELVIWGGCGGDLCKNVYGDGARFTPDATGGHWSTVAEQPGLSPRRGAAGVATSTAIYIWGGRANEKDRLATGAESVL